MFDNNIYLIEAVEVPFSVLLVNDPRFLEKILVDVSTDRISLKIEMYVHVFPETRRVVVPVGFRIAESFQNRIRLYQYILHSLYVIVSSCEKNREEIKTPFLSDASSSL